MSFAVHLGELTDEEMSKLRNLHESAPWRDIPARQYDTADVNYWEPCSRAFFIRVPSGGNIHRHHDAFIPGRTHHLVLQTNPKAFNWWMDGTTERSIHLKQGHKYLVDRHPMHWATNDGEYARIHLLVEYE